MTGRFTYRLGVHIGYDTWLRKIEDNGFTFISIGMAGRTRVRAWMMFRDGRYFNDVLVQAADRWAVWHVPNIKRGQATFIHGDRNLKPKNCGGVPKHLHRYVTTHARNFETLLSEP